jgi:TIR domain-containing protein
MSNALPEPKRHAFISHSSANLDAALEIEKALEANGLDVWLDRSEIQLGTLLSGELQSSISDCRVLILLWSERAAASRWVNTEWLAAHHLDRFIFPCVLDDKPLPQCFEHNVYLDLRRDRDDAIARLANAVRVAKIGMNTLAPPMRAESPELRDAIQSIVTGQQLVTDSLGQWNLKKAEAAQAKLDEVMPEVLARFPFDPMILKLDGYHIKNDYMVRHWAALQGGRGPADPALEQSEQRFFEALWLDPLDPSGLDGLGSIMMLRRDLHAAEFFFVCAIRQAERSGFRYDAAEENLESVRYYLGKQKP